MRQTTLQEQYFLEGSIYICIGTCLSGHVCPGGTSREQTPHTGVLAEKPFFFVLLLSPVEIERTKEGFHVEKRRDDRTASDPYHSIPSRRLVRIPFWVGCSTFRMGLLQPLLISVMPPHSSTVPPTHDMTRLLFVAVSLLLKFLPSPLVVLMPSGLGGNWLPKLKEPVCRPSEYPQQFRPWIELCWLGKGTSSSKRTSCPAQPTKPNPHVRFLILPTITNSVWGLWSMPCVSYAYHGTSHHLNHNLFPHVPTVCI